MSPAFAEPRAVAAAVLVVEKYRGGGGGDRCGGEGRGLEVVIAGAWTAVGDGGVRVPCMGQHSSLRTLWEGTVNGVLPVLVGGG